MVTHNIACIKDSRFFERENIQYCSRFNQMTLTNQTTEILRLRCAPFSELPSNISSMDLPFCYSSPEAILTEYMNPQKLYFNIQERERKRERERERVNEWKRVLQIFTYCVSKKKWPVLYYYYIKWITTSWTYSNKLTSQDIKRLKNSSKGLYLAGIFARLIFYVENIKIERETERNCQFRLFDASRHKIYKPSKFQTLVLSDMDV